MVTNDKERDFEEINTRLRFQGRFDPRLLNNVNDAGDGFPGLQKLLRNWVQYWVKYYLHNGVLEQDLDLNNKNIDNSNEITATKIISDDVDCGKWCNQGYLINLFGVKLPILDFDDILPVRLAFTEVAGAAVPDIGDPIDRGAVGLDVQVEVPGAGVVLADVEVFEDPKEGVSLHPFPGLAVVAEVHVVCQQRVIEVPKGSVEASVAVDLQAVEARSVRVVIHRLVGVAADFDPHVVVGLRAAPQTPVAARAPVAAGVRHVVNRRGARRGRR